MDITFKTEEGRFNFRACAVILQKGKILAMHDERSPYYFLPGGWVQLLESAEQAVLREVREELGAEAEIIRPLWLNQAFFTEDVEGERFHELCVYFLMDISNSRIPFESGAFIRREGAHRHVFEWLELEQLEKEYFYPLFLKKEIFHLPEGLTLRTEYE